MQPGFPARDLARRLFLRLRLGLRVKAELNAVNIYISRVVPARTHVTSVYLEWQSAAPEPYSAYRSVAINLNVQVAITVNGTAIAVKPVSGLDGKFPVTLKILRR